jgi:hypothetical protein
MVLDPACRVGARHLRSRKYTYGRAVPLSLRTGSTHETTQSVQLSGKLRWQGL